VHPERWLATIAHITTRLRSKLRDYGDSISWADELTELLVDEGLPPYASGAEMAQHGSESEQVRGGEIEYCLWESWRYLLQRGEIFGIDTNAGLMAHTTQIKALARYLKWPKPENWDLSPPPPAVAFATTLRVSSSQVDPDTPTGWPSVERLLHEARAARNVGLLVAAVVVARVTVEEAIRLALTESGCSGAEGKKAWEAENALFDECLRSPTGFAPMDRTATRATLSCIRNLGNEVSHNGDVADEATAHSLLLQMPRAVASLFNAVNAQRSG